MDQPFAIKWKLADVLEHEGVSAETLTEVLGGKISAETLAGWLAGQPETLELAALGSLLWGLGQLSGREYGVSDVLEYEILIVGA